jgi:AcrR family transcriptional regulator
VAFSDESGERSKVRRILDAAASVFARRGFSEARMDDVADEAGVSKGGLYLHFKSKDDLFDALMSHIVGLEARRLAKAGAGDGPVADRLVAYFREYVRDMVGMERFYPIIMEIYARAARHESVRRMLLRYFDAAVPDLSALIAAGIESGEFRSADPDEVAIQLVGMLEGLAIMWALAPDRFSLPDGGDRAVRVFIDGLLARPGPSSPQGGAS